MSQQGLRHSETSISVILENSDRMGATCTFQPVTHLAHPKITDWSTCSSQENMLWLPPSLSFFSCTFRCHLFCSIFACCSLVQPPPMRSLYRRTISFLLFIFSTEGTLLILLCLLLLIHNYLHPTGEQDAHHWLALCCYHLYSHRGAAADWCT